MISRNFDCKHPFLCPVCAIIARSELSYLTTLISFSLVFFDFLAFSYASIMKNAVSPPSLFGSGEKRHIVPGENDQFRPKRNRQQPRLVI